MRVIRKLAAILNTAELADNTCERDWLNFHHCIVIAKDWTCTERLVTYVDFWPLIVLEEADYWQINARVDQCVKKGLISDQQNIEVCVRYDPNRELEVRANVQYSVRVSDD